MARPRVHNKNLPEGWAFKHGAFYYRPGSGVKHLWDNKAWFKLGTTLREALDVWQARVESNREIKIRTIGDLLNRYALNVIPTKKPITQESNFNSLPFLLKVFRDVPVSDLRPTHIYQYFEARSKKKQIERDSRMVTIGGVTTAKRDIEMLSHAFTKAVEWGALDRHPFKGEVTIQANKPRDRYVTAEEVAGLLSVKPQLQTRTDRTVMLQALVKLKVLTGLRQRDLLLLNLDNIQEDGLFVIPSKTDSSTKKKILFEWTDNLRFAINFAMETRVDKTNPLIFQTSKGTSYVSKGKTQSFKNIWGRFIDRAIEQGLIAERFTEHDLRAHAGSEAETLEHAMKLLGHSNPQITKRVYRRGVEKVKPIK